MESLAGEVALVTGADRGIGRAIAVALARAGADIAVNYHTREDEALEVVKEIQAAGRRASAVKADVSFAIEVALMTAEVERDLAPVSILVNNAGIGPHRSIEEISEEDWDQVIAVNLKSAFLAIQAVLPGMRSRRRGRIINISSVAAQTGGVVGPHYAASKAGLLGLTRYYASALARDGITVNAIAPGAIATEMAATLPQLRPEMIPVGRLGTAEEVASVAVMLSLNGYITGQTINVNGGKYPG